MPDSEIIFAGDHPPSTINWRTKRGEIRRLARGIYRLANAPGNDAEIVRRNWRTIAAHLTPGAVITDRSARTGQPVDHILYVSHNAAKRVVLPGLTIDARKGPGPQPGDIPTPDGLHLASRERGLVDNTAPSRQRAGRPARTFTEAEIGDWIDELARRDPDKLAGIRDCAERLARTIGHDPKHVAIVSRHIGAAIGTQPTVTRSAALNARQKRAPYDSTRTARFDALQAALRRAAPQHHPIDSNNGHRYNFQPFFESYFSNYIEGTEFAVDAAAAIVFDGEIPTHRPADAHDILGTYRAITETSVRSRPATADEFITMLRDCHAAIMVGRPDRRPGKFKEIANQAGSTLFVAPDLVNGTLREGFARLDNLDSGFERAVYAMFLIAEIHPFDDGNGRAARVMMNAELSHYNENRIIVPTVFRTNYLNGLRRLSRDDDPSILIKALRYAHDFTNSVDFADFDASIEQLAAVNAFEDPESGVHLGILNPDDNDPTDFARGEAARRRNAFDHRPVVVGRYLRPDGKLVQPTHVGRCDDDRPGDGSTAVP